MEEQSHSVQEPVHEEEPAGDDAAQRSGPPEDWREAKVSELSDLCQAEGLPTSGKRADLIKRLELHFTGSSNTPRHGRVACPYCKAYARCNGTRSMSETVVRRSYRCEGRRRHSFTLDSQINP